jgi:TonB family protein
MGSRLKSPPDYYDVLEVSREASPEEIKAAFVRLIRPFNRRLQENSPEQVDQARQINVAYLTLGDPSKRRAYDASLASPGGTAEPAKAKHERAAFLAAQRAAGPDVLSTGLNEQKPKQTTARSHRSPEAPAPGVAKPVEPAAQIAHGFEANEPASPKSASTRPQARTAFLIPPGVPLPKHDIPEALLAQRKTEPGTSETTAAAGNFDGPPEAPDNQDAPLDEEARPNRRKAALLGAGMLVVVGSFAVLSTQIDRPRSSTGSAARPAANGSPAGTAALSSTPSLAAPKQTPAEALLTPESMDPTAVPPPPETKLVQADKTVAATPAGSVPAAGPAKGGAQPAVKDDKPPADVSPKSQPESAVQVAASAAPVQAPSPASPARIIPVPTPDRTAPAQHISGSLLNSDNPRGQYQGTVKVRFSISTTGRAAGCRTLVSSGNPMLDARTCELVEQRMRFSPALNRAGQPAPSQMDASYTWGKRGGRALTSKLWNLVRGKPKN